jgi:hypothetical protein
VRYLQGKKKDYVLTFKKSDHLEVISYSDSNFVGFVDSRKSTFDFLASFLLIKKTKNQLLINFFFSKKKKISWKSAKHTIIVASTMKGEFMTCFETTVNGLWLQNFILELKNVDTIIKWLKIYCGNSAVVFQKKIF